MQIELTKMYENFMTIMRNLEEFHQNFKLCSSKIKSYRWKEYLTGFLWDFFVSSIGYSPGYSDKILVTPKRE